MEKEINSHFGGKGRKGDRQIMIAQYPDFRQQSERLFRWIRRQLRSCRREGKERGQADNDCSILDVKVLHAQARAGLQWDASVGVVNVGFSDDENRNKIHMDILSLKSGYGIRNPDGSTGVNVGISGTIIAVEGTATTPNAKLSVTFGAGVTLKGEASLGFRDIDNDGITKICGRLSLSWWTLGACVESF